MFTKASLFLSYENSPSPSRLRRVRPWATIPLSNQLPVYCYLFQILFTVSVRGAQDPCIVIPQ